jgi:aminoglycoside 6'-N-acetyltransferase
MLCFIQKGGLWKMENTALVIIDMQKAMYSAEAPCRGLEVLDNIRQLLQKARNIGMPVVFVQHNNDRGLKIGSDLWQVCPEIAPIAGEARVDKTTRDSFHQTELDSILRRLEIKTLIFCGMQTEYCVDTTCRRAYTLGYDAYLVSDGHSTFDSKVLPASQIIAHHNFVLQTRFLKVKSAGEMLEMMGA